MSEAGPAESERRVESEKQTGPSAVVPIAGSLRSEPPKKPFWKRISLRGRSEGSLSSPTDDDRILARLDAIAAQLVASEHGIGQRIDQLDEKFSEVWEVEETLSRLMELHELLTDMRDRQGRIDGRMRGLERRLSFVALLAGTAAAAGIAATIAVLAF